jgi:effector-binding domain-containing protein
MPTVESITAARTEAAPVTAVQIHCECKPDPQSISAEMGRAFSLLGEFIGRNRLRPCAPPRTIYTGYGPDGMKMTVAMPVETPATPVPAGGPIRIGTLPAEHTLTFTHRGPYRELMATYNRIAEYLKAEGLMESEADWDRYMPMWEEYLNDPATTPESGLLTHIHLPLR